MDFPTKETLKNPRILKITGFPAHGTPSASADGFRLSRQETMDSPGAGGQVQISERCDMVLSMFFYAPRILPWFLWKFMKIWQTSPKPLVSLWDGFWHHIPLKIVSNNDMGWTPANPMARCAGPPSSVATPCANPPSRRRVWPKAAPRMNWQRQFFWVWRYRTRVIQWDPFLGGMQIYGNFEGISLKIEQCLGWWHNDPSGILISVAY